jgi:ketosteroid isomerase-like protein
MRNMLLRLTMVCALLGGALSAQDKSGKAAAKMERYDFHPLMQQIWDAWGTLNPDNAARFYSKDPTRTFFDLAPLKYVGWTEYSTGVKKTFADYASAKFTLSPSQHVVQRPNMAWASTTGHGILTKKSGAKDEIDFRWTVIWDKEGTDWLIVHEHVSVPMAASAPAPAVKPAPTSAVKPATAPKK